MELRLGAALTAEAGLAKSGVTGGTAAAALPAEMSEGVGAVPQAAAEAASTGGLFGDDAPWPTDETTENSFLADARERGETVVPVLPVTAAREEPEETGALPALDDLVQRIPAEVRELLEELYRVKFTAVRRVPAKLLK